jgi:nicotinamidase/pyrazinamidase
VALLVVDVQGDFTDDFENAALPVTGGGDTARRINAYLRERLGASGVRGGYDLLVTTQDWHIQPGTHFARDSQPDFTDTWPFHCVAATPGAAFHRDLFEGLPDDLIDLAVHKGQFAPAYSGFEGAVVHAPVDERLVGVPLAEALRFLGITCVHIAGIATDYCVRTSALDAFREGFEVVVVTDLCAGIAPHTIAAALDELAAAGVALLDHRAAAAQLAAPTVAR